MHDTYVVVLPLLPLVHICSVYASKGVGIINVNVLTSMHDVSH